MTRQQKIQEALDNSILDWNSPRQLNSILKDDIYPTLTSTISRLIDEEVVAELGRWRTFLVDPFLRYELAARIGALSNPNPSLTAWEDTKRPTAGLEQEFSALKGDTND